MVEPPPLTVAEPVRDALAAGEPVVALESTIISHGLPRPRNLEAARRFEALLAEEGVTPATIAVLDGQLRIGLTSDELRRIAGEDEAVKVSVRDLPVVMARAATGGTTVAATSHLAAMAGIRVFATGGLGGVHRGETLDESADLPTLASTPITVVSAGVKSILDIAGTLERLETLGVTVLGYRTTCFPGFWLTDSGHPLDWRVDDVGEVARMMAANDRLGRRAAILVANPLPAAEQLDPDVHDRVLREALAAADARGVRGKDVSPFLLSFIVEATGGASVEVNLRIVEHNVRLGAAIARAWSELRRAERR
jgi:pseudouridine-5'-phosphate glycosidase